MTIENIKNNIDSKKGNNVKVIYNDIFIIKTDGNEVKSFSYRDVLTNTIELFFDKV